MPSPAEAALLALFAAAPSAAQPQRPMTVAAQAELDLKATLLRRFKAADARAAGVFHEDVTADVAPLFPAGQPFRETQAIVRAQGLGDLKKFRGEPHEGTSMYVARFRLEAEMFGEVFVVLDFDFDGTDERDMRLKRMKAFLRASNM